MKSFLSKVKKCCRNFINGKAAFSLVELIVVIAIMAVMAAVLAPALLGYVERSRAQKDDSAMDEVTNAITLSIADSTIYDEVLQASVKDNYSCYADGDTSTNIDANKTITKSPDLWLFNDNARLLDETVYIPSGKMRGVTVTFKPNGSAEYILKEGIVNQMGNDSTKKGSLAGKTLEDIGFEGLYNRLRSTVGDTIKVNSQTYRNSDYTIFISLGTTGGNQADKQDAIQVYGQYNGTNLPEVASASNVAGGSQDKGNAGSEDDSNKTETTINHNGPTIPEGAYYGNMNIETMEITWYTEMPETPTQADIYCYDSYVYAYGSIYGGWDVHLATERYMRDLLPVGFIPADENQTVYNEILENINGQPIICINNTFTSCNNLTAAPTIPNDVTDINNAFFHCSSLTTAPDLKNNTNLETMANTFNSCTSLTTAPVIPSSVTNMSQTFLGCTALTGTIEINANPTRYSYCFSYVDFKAQNITLTGTSTMIDAIGATGKNYCAECNGVCLGAH